MLPKQFADYHSLIIIARQVVDRAGIFPWFGFEPIASGLCTCNWWYNLIMLKSHSGVVG
jgi:hypothetical protein